MARSVLEIIIQMVKKGGADKDTIRGLNDVKRALTAGAAAVGTLVGAYYTLDKIQDATVGKFVSYAGVIRQNSAALSLDAEETSRLTQVLGDFGIEIDSVQKSLFKARQDGIDVTVEGLAALADEFNALADPQAQAIFLQDKFGKGGTALAEVLKMGSAAILEHNAGIQAGLILDDKAVQMAFEYEQAVDDLNDSKLALAITTGQKLIPLEIKSLQYINQSVTAWQGLDEQVLLFFGLLQAKMPYLSGATQGFQALVGAILGGANISEKIASVQTASDNYDILADSIANAATQQANFTLLTADFGDKYSAVISYAEDYRNIADEIVAVEQEIAEARKVGYLETGQKITELKQKLDELQQKQQEQTDRWILNVLTQQLSIDGLTQAEMAFLLEYQVDTGLILAEDAKRAASLYDYALALANIPSTKHVSIIQDFITQGQPYISGGGGGGPAPVMRAEGGTLGPMSVVGERGWEAIVRTRDGRYLVIPHEASVWMQAAGLLGAAPGYALGNLPMMDQALGGGSSNQSTGYIPSSNQSTGSIHPNLNPAAQTFGYSAPASAPSAAAAVEQASAQAAEMAVESVAPVVQGAVQMFQAAQAANAIETARATRIAEEGNADEKRLLTAILNTLESHPEMLAAEMQKHK